MSETPRVDANEQSQGMGSLPEMVVSADFARTLERELAAVTRERDEARNDAHAWSTEALERVGKLHAERDALRAEVESLRKDAARYRWLRHGDNDEQVICRGPVDMNYVYLLRAEKLDAAIDAAITPAEVKHDD